MQPPDTAGEVQAQKDTIIQHTDNDASVSRLSAINTGYLHDDYAHSFVLARTARRLPIINRGEPYLKCISCGANKTLGTYVRTVAIDRLVDAFLASNQSQNVQIISLGAGTDTRYWRLREKNPHQAILYHEIDFPAVSKNKLAAIRYSKKLSPIGSGFFTLHTPRDPIDPEKNRWGFYRNEPVNTDGYFFHPIDLRKMPPRIDDLQTGDVPTLLISECCLCYLSPEEAQSVIRTFSNLIPNLGIVIYEPTNPNSEFGKVMAQNLAMRGLSMPTIQKYPTLQSQLARLRDAGFLHSQNGADILWLWNNWVPPYEKERIADLELVDEVEEWELLAKHYTVTWGWRELGSQGHFTEWKTNCLGQIQYPKPSKGTGEDNEGAVAEMEGVL